MSDKTILLIETFYGGSHKQLIDLLLNEFSECADLFTLPSKKWHWRSLVSCFHFAEVIPKQHKYRVLFSSSVLPLAELVAMRPDLGMLHKIVYFHENQMTYPVQIHKARYFQHGFNEALTCLTADRVLFNSHYNRESFLSSLQHYFNILPDYKPKDLRKKIEPKTAVLYFPVNWPENEICYNSLNDSNEELSDPELKADSKVKPLHIVWPHRWEHDKNPEAFFSIMYKLKEEALPFQLSVLGESFSEKPDIFLEAQEVLKDNITHWGYQETKESYFSVLRSADIVVSTANHEFFGVSMLEATGCNCFPLCPNRLVYPELYPAAHLYNTNTQLFKILKYFCRKPFAVRNKKIEYVLILLRYTVAVQVCIITSSQYFGSVVIRRTFHWRSNNEPCHEGGHHKIFLEKSKRELSTDF